jgi:hypothetical protein
VGISDHITHNLYFLFSNTPHLALAPSHFFSDYKTDLIKGVKKEKAAKAFKK